MGSERRSWPDLQLGRGQREASGGGQPGGLSQRKGDPESTAVFGQREASGSSPGAGVLTEWEAGQRIHGE